MAIVATVLILAAVGVAIYMLLLFGAASLVETVKLNNAQEAAKIMGLLKKALRSEKIDIEEWANVRWSVGDAYLDSLLRRAWTKLGDWSCKEDLLTTDKERAERLQAEFRNLLQDIHKSLSAPPRVVVSREEAGAAEN